MLDHGESITPSAMPIMSVMAIVGFRFPMVFAPIRAVDFKLLLLSGCMADKMNVRALNIVCQ